MKASVTRTLLYCGAVAGPLFTIVWLIDGATRTGYDPMRHPISGLAIGDAGWAQIISFVVTGLLTLALAVGLRRVVSEHGCPFWAPWLVGAMAVGFIGSGLFVTDPLNGYPPGTPNLPERLSTSGLFHARFSMIMSLALALLIALFTRFSARQGERGWVFYSAVTLAIFLLMSILMNLGFSQIAYLVDYTGLFQRIALVVGLTWLTLFALYMARIERIADPE